jgi:hypothetical protein
VLVLCEMIAKCFLFNSCQGNRTFLFNYNNYCSIIILAMVYTSKGISYINLHFKKKSIYFNKNIAVVTKNKKGGLIIL